MTSVIESSSSKGYQKLDQCELTAAGEDAGEDEDEEDEEQEEHHQGQETEDSDESDTDTSDEDGSASDCGKYSPIKHNVILIKQFLYP